MSWLPHPSTWGKKNSKPPSLIPVVSGRVIELLRSIGVKAEEVRGDFPLFEIKVTPMPFPKRRNFGSSLIDMNFKYGKEENKEK